MDIFQSALPEFFVGVGSADATRKSIVEDGYAPEKLYKGVRLRAHSDNTDVLYIGRENVTVANGFPLQACEEVDIPIDDLHKIFIVAATVGDYAWIAV